MRFHSVYLIARREFVAYVTTVGFWLSVTLVPVFMAFGAMMPQILAAAKPPTHFAILDETGRYADIVRQAVAEARRADLRADLHNFAATQADAAAASAALARFDSEPGSTEEAARDALANVGINAGAFSPSRPRLIESAVDGQTPEDLRAQMQRAVQDNQAPPLDAFLVIRNEENGPALDYWSANLADHRLLDIAERAVAETMRIDALNRAGVSVSKVAAADALRPQSRLLSPIKSAGAEEVTRRDEMRFAAGALLAFLLWMLVFSVANMLLASVLEEKSTKVMESLLVSARMSEILAGKLIGVGAISFCLLGVWAVSTLGLGSLAAGQGDGFADIIAAFTDPHMLIAFAACFVAGYLMYGAVFLAVGSLCETPQEAQTLMSPIIFVLMAPLIGILAAMDNPSSTFVSTMAWMPIFTPFMMLARLPSNPPLWEIVAAVALMVGTALAVLFLAARVFRAGVLGGGKSFLEGSRIAKWLRRPAKPEQG